MVGINFTYIALFWNNCTGTGWFIPCRGASGVILKDMSKKTHTNPCIYLMRFTAPAYLSRQMISIESTCGTLSAASGVVLWCVVPGPQLLCWVGLLGHPCKKYQWWFHIWVKQGKLDRGLVKPMASHILANIDRDNGMSPNDISVTINLYNTFLWKN